MAKVKILSAKNGNRELRWAFEKQKKFLDENLSTWIKTSTFFNNANFRTHFARLGVTFKTRHGSIWKSANCFIIHCFIIRPYFLWCYICVLQIVIIRIIVLIMCLSILGPNFFDTNS